MLDVDLNVADCEPLVVALRRVARSLDRTSRRLMRDHGITSAQRALLNAVFMKPGASVGEIAQAAGLGQATVTDTLDRLVARGLVVRTRSALDRRRVEVRLTPAAERLVSQLPLPLPESFVTRYRALPEGDRRELVAAVERLATLMDSETRR